MNFRLTARRNTDQTHNEGLAGKALPAIIKHEPGHEPQGKVKLDKREAAEWSPPACHASPLAANGVPRAGIRRYSGVTVIVVVPELTEPPEPALTAWTP